MHVKKEKAIWNHHQIYFSYYHFCYCKSGLGDTGIILGLVRVFPKGYKQTKQRSTGQLTSPPCRHINTHVYSFTSEHRTQRLAVLLSKFGFHEIHCFILIKAKYFPHHHFHIQIFTYVQALSSFHLLGRIFYASPHPHLINTSSLPVAQFFFTEHGRGLISIPHLSGLLLHLMQHKINKERKKKRKKKGLVLVGQW